MSIFENYLRQKNKNNIRLEKKEDKIIIRYNQYDIFTGEVVEEKILEIPIDELIKQRQLLMKQLENINALLNDIERL